MNSEENMRRKLSKLAFQYHSALQKFLSQGPRASLHKARELGRRAIALGLETLDMARLHEDTLIALIVNCPVGTREGLVARAGSFFAEAITPIEDTHRTALEANVRLGRLNQALHRQSVDLAASNRELKQEIVRRRRIEESLRDSERHYALLLEQSRHLQEQLRSLSRQLLSAQEEERKRISRELHDEIAQTLLGIHVRLLTLRTGAEVNAHGLKKEVASTQRLVGKSRKLMARYTRELGRKHET